jgi:hypothetical protein
VDIQEPILFASVQTQFLSGTALADIRHLNLLQKYPLRTLVKLCGIAGQVHIPSVVYVAVDVCVAVVQLPSVIELHIGRECQPRELDGFGASGTFLGKLLHRSQGHGLLSLTIHQHPNGVGFAYVLLSHIKITVPIQPFFLRLPNGGYGSQGLAPFQGTGQGDANTKGHPGSMIFF